MTEQLNEHWSNLSHVKRRKTMKRLVYLIPVVMFGVILSACASKTPQPSDEMINPGDRIGDSLITTGEGEDVIFVTKLIAPLIVARRQSLVSNL